MTEPAQHSAQRLHAQHAHIKRLAALLGKPTEPPKEQT